MELTSQQLKQAEQKLQQQEQQLQVTLASLICFQPNMYNT